MAARSTRQTAGSYSGLVCEVGLHCEAKTVATSAVDSAALCLVLQG